MFDASAIKTTNALGDLSIRVMNEKSDYIGHEVASPLYVPKADFKWYIMDLANMRDEDDAKSSKSEADEIEYSAFTKSGKAILYKLSARIDPNDERDADEVVSDIEATHAENIAEVLLRKHEGRVATAATTSANYVSGNSVTLSGTDQFSDANSDPIGVFEQYGLAVDLACGKRPTHAAMSLETFLTLRRHPQLIGRYNAIAAQLSKEQVAELLGVQDILIGKARKNTAKEGQTDVLGRIWGKDICLFVKNDAQTKKSMSFMRTFMVDQFTTRTYELPNLGGSKPLRKIQSSWEYVVKGVGQNSAGLFTAGAVIKAAIA
jgi:hypothetical protein